MTIKLPQPADKWTPAYQARVNQAVEAYDVTVRHKGEDIDLARREKLILRSPSGARWQVVVADDGTLSATAL